MHDAWKPAGYSSVSPYLVVTGADALIDYLKRAFDGEPLRRFEAPDGTVAHAEVRLDDTVVMIGEAGESWPPTPGHIHLYVPDVDDAFRRAVAAGGTVVREPVRQADDPDRRGGVKGPAGNTWWLSTQQ